ncbi:hypothetical protein MFRU_019g00680 [Monilinia fructicola]|nr:hypothetical protein MFRU_019g00680 [Monilinia fructicola]
MKRLPKAFFPFCLLVYGSSSNNSPQVEAQVEFWESGGTSPGGRADLQQELDQALALKTSVCMQQLKNYRIVDSGDRASTPGTKLCYSIPRDSLDGHLFRVFIVSDNHLDNGTGPPGARGYGVLCPKKHLTEEGTPTR